MHSFDNIVEYHLKLLLSDILAKKAKKARKDVEEFGVVQDDGLGRTSLFISMIGPVSDPVISYDSQGAREKIKNDLGKEKQSMKQSSQSCTPTSGAVNGSWLLQLATSEYPPRHSHLYI